MARHGRAVMPWGAHRGVRIKLLPDSYLSFLTTTAVVKDPKWAWLRDSLIAEMRHRGLDVEHLFMPCSECGGSGRSPEAVLTGCDTTEKCPACGGSGEVPRPDEPVELPEAPVVAPRPRRAFKL